MKNMYKVYRIDICFTCYARNYILVGGNSKADVIEHLEEIVENSGNDIDYLYEEIDSLLNIGIGRVEKVKNLYTDKPYIVLENFAYYE